MQKTYRDRAIVLRTADIGEADRIITLFTERHGKIRAVAKGVRKTKSRFGARLEPFSYIDIQLYRGRGLDIVSQVESINQYQRRLATDYSLYTVASSIVETADHIMEQEEVADYGQFLLLYGALHALASRTLQPLIILDSYILRILQQSGWELAIKECAQCGEVGVHTALQLDLGGLLCNKCRTGSSGSIMPEAALLLAALVDGDWEKAVSAPANAKRSVNALLNAYLQWHLERPVKSLQFVDSKLIS